MVVEGRGEGTETEEGIGGTGIEGGIMTGTGGGVGAGTGGEAERGTEIGGRGGRETEETETGRGKGELQRNILLWLVTASSNSENLFFLGHFVLKM